MPINIEGLKFTYSNGGPFEKNALHDINIDIQNGEFIGIIGHTGSGKSTLIQHLNGILKPTAGRVIINGIDTKQKDLKELRRQVGIVFQYPEHQLFEDTVKKDISFGLLKQGLSEEEIQQRVISALHSVGLDESILEKSPFELSGGQKRRVAIAGVVAMMPKILVLDEPTAGLDPSGRDEIFGYIKELHRDFNMTVILVSHSMEDIAKLAGRVIVMNEGTVYMDKPSGEVYTQPDQLEKIGLSAPQITYLMKRLKTILPDIDENIFTVEAAVKELQKHLKQ
ncbi:energy-coupling factor transporter ATPase [Ruminiclostridium cellobioparum]|jgi:energy-coupling factor transport system ATP-binding protein|uniref:Energy-coupling factor transporter ATP-binding protein EcfA2 n=1 Tax=Ruminiclostridium cellobioparum subsp. termitidis CT1112 TaxID=1195236 RepID=S0FI78_RUMCE|nr:energy-coupling factor transporter ATPase [Ruminiclostridium cellobioparum]EMS71307.1 ABC-type cobalt transport system, ATPase component [Ruminiclostridium cellobioparum subsp. termitidis CT1112]